MTEALDDHLIGQSDRTVTLGASVAVDGRRYFSPLLDEQICKVSSRIMAACFETLKISAIAAVSVSAAAVPAETVAKPTLVMHRETHLDHS